MPTTSYLWAAVLCSTAVTLALRAIPFTFIGPLRESSYMRYLADRMPVGLMLILVVYSVQGTVSDSATAGRAGIALAVTVGLHLWKSNAILSMFAGTAVYAALASLAG